MADSNSVHSCYTFNLKSFTSNIYILGMKGVFPSSFTFCCIVLGLGKHFSVPFAYFAFGQEPYPDSIPV